MSERRVLEIYAPLPFDVFTKVLGALCDAYKDHTPQPALFVRGTDNGFLIVEVMPVAKPGGETPTLEA